MQRAPPALPLFSAHGIELEYMIVERGSHGVLPIADRLLEAAAGEQVEEFVNGAVSWSNELALHLVELKCTCPAEDLAPLAALFQDEVRKINAQLHDFGGRLMPTAMHPWMDPNQETRLWPHGHNEVYAAFDRIFDCTGHGWSNLQSMHINLPFADDREFGLLHAAIRVLIPIMPALAASSPIVQWDRTGLMDTRLEVYRTNARRIPSVTGLVVPEPAVSRDEYMRVILEPMYADLAPHDPDGILRHEWLNSRGAIARFERSTIEIRVLDVQELPCADLAVAGIIVDTLRALAASRWSGRDEQNALVTGALAEVLQDVIRDGDLAVIRDRKFLGVFGYPERSGCAGEIWQHLLESRIADGTGPWYADDIRFILREGCLASRIVRAVGNGARRSHIEETYRVLCDCLDQGTRFERIG